MSIPFKKTLRLPDVTGRPADNTLVLGPAAKSPPSRLEKRKANAAV
jgi:hypothetical protein